MGLSNGFAPKQSVPLTLLMKARPKKLKKRSRARSRLMKMMILPNPLQQNPRMSMLAGPFSELASASALLEGRSRI